MNLKKLLLVLFAVIFFIYSQAGDININKVEPPCWWIGMKEGFLQLMVYGDNIAITEPGINYAGVTIEQVHRTSNPNYLFIDLNIEKNTAPGIVPLIFNYEGKDISVYDFQLFKRRKDSESRKGFSPEDVIYLLFPDRFSNGDITNDDMDGMLQKSDRLDLNGRHGGDIRGIVDHLDYIHDLGVTTLWVNPLLENNMPWFSYHGYSITDFYKVDPRFGTNQDYADLVQACHQRGIKVIMDMVFNHCGSYHWWMNDLPEESWINQWPVFTRTKYRNPVIPDPHSSQYDLLKMQKGWFDITMPDLNQHNPYLANYLVQNSIWWIEYADLNGIRMDTYPYAFQDFMATWVKKVLDEYPNINIVGETWLQKESLTGYFMGDPESRLGPDTHLPSVTDFPLYFALSKALNEEESWTGGLNSLYYVLAQDIVYHDPLYNVIFPDNHDLTRYYTTMQKDPDKYKMGIAFILTTRGIPMPGGWPGDPLDAFVSTGRSPQQEEAYQYMKNLLNWRKENKAIHNGKLIQFIPEDNTYVYFRIHGDESVMVILNKNITEKTVETARFTECLEGFGRGKSVITGDVIQDLSSLIVPAMSANIIELIK
jgi:glycosidase